MAETLTASYLRYLIDKGKHARYDPIFGCVPPEVDTRIEHELNVIIPNHFDDYILILTDIHDFCRTPSRVFEFCKRKGLTPPPDGIIPIGPGRGSVGGSMVCYCLNIHQCDPLLFNLYFERFLNSERIAYPDIDFDISQKYRYIGVAYIADTYGEEYVSQIITFGTESCKTCIHDVLAAANVSNSVINAIKTTVSDEPGITFADLDNNEKFMAAMQAIEFPDVNVPINKSNIQKIINVNNWERGTEIDIQNRAEITAVLTGTKEAGTLVIKSTWTWQKALRIMKRIEGIVKTESVHAAGVVVAPVKLAPNIPLMKRAGEGVRASQYDMRSLEAIGYLKMDALGLRTVDVNHEAEALVRKWYDKDFDMSKLRLDDKETINLINSGDTIGIFQIESSGFTKMMQDLDIGGYEVPRYVGRDPESLSMIEKKRGKEIQDFMWISAGIAMYRPGPLDAIIEGKTMVQHLIDRKAGREPVVYLFDEEKDYLEETYGVLVYQEQVMARVRQMTGCSLGRADILRKAMGKKDKILMKAQMDWFENEAMKYKFSAKDIPNKAQIVARAKEEIAKFARYGFNKAHTVEYGHNCYWNAYYKAHYPIAFYVALLNSLTDKPKKQTTIIADMLKHGIKLLPPTVNESNYEFTIISKDTIRFGLNAIKGLGQKAVVGIINDRKARGLYKSIEEFRIRIPATDCNVAGMESLAKCGAFSDMTMNSQQYSRATIFASMRNMCKAMKRITAKKPKKPAPTIDESLAKYIANGIAYTIIEDKEDLITYAVWEKEILKYYISAHPIDAYVEELKRWTSIGDIEQDDLPDEFYIGGFVEGVHETIIKKEGRNKGKRMGFVTVGTQYRTYDATMFPGIYESCIPYLKQNNPIVLKGKRDVYKDKVTIQCEYIRNLTNKGIRDCPECHIRLPEDINSAQLIRLKSAMDQYPGITKVFLHIIDGYDDVTVECGQLIAVNDYIIDLANSIGNLSYKPN